MSCTRKVSLLGSTGSIGLNTLNVVRQNREKFRIVSLSCGSSLQVLKRQIEEFSPLCVSVATKELGDELSLSLTGSCRPQIFWGVEGHRRVISESAPDVLISAMSGTFGLQASLESVRQGVSVLGIANKEILVMAGPFILEALKTSKTELIPVDSEHSAIFQALMGNKKSAVKQIILTGSGGPFRTRTFETFESIRKEEALKHPNWSMGAKITIDSSTMMNKGLEYIEAIRLFDLTRDQVRIIIHPESIVHSLVEYCDGSIMAQLGLSDMRIPISLALAYPERLPLELGRSLKLSEVGALHFEEPDFDRFPCLRLAIDAETMGATGPIVLNAANEMAVPRFLKDEMGYLDIPRLVEDALDYFSSAKVGSLDDVIELDGLVKAWAGLWSRSSRITRTKGRLPTLSHETIGL